MKIKLELTNESIDSAIAQVEAYQNKFISKCELLLSRLSEIGIDTMEVRYNTIYTGGSISCRVEQGTNIVKLFAEGDEVAFVEFGTGVHYLNQGNAYLGTRPPGIGEIGTYGKGLGKYDKWYHYGVPRSDQRSIPTTRGLLVEDHGMPPHMGLYYAMQDMVEAITNVAREVFSND